MEFKKQMKQLNIGDVEDMVDDLADLMEDMNEVNEIMGRSYAMPDHIDEADLEAELDMLGEDLESSVAEPSYLEPSLPAQPTKAPSAPAMSATRVDEYGLPLVG